MVIQITKGVTKRIITMMVKGVDVKVINIITTRKVFSLLNDSTTVKLGNKELFGHHKIVH